MHFNLYLLFIYVFFSVDVNATALLMLSMCVCAELIRANESCDDLFSFTVLGWCTH